MTPQADYLAREGCLPDTGWMAKLLLRARVHHQQSGAFMPYCCVNLGCPQKAPLVPIKGGWVCPACGGVFSLEAGVPPAADLVLRASRSVGVAVQPVGVIYKPVVGTSSPPPPKSRTEMTKAELWATIFRA